MLVFSTESGSVYELDISGKRLRRMTGNTPLSRVGPHGEWKEFADVSAVKVGDPVIVIWRWVIENDMPVAKTTCTSRVTDVLSIDGSAN